jgi:hypothetical protein
MDLRVDVADPRIEESTRTRRRRGKPPTSIRERAELEYVDRRSVV